MVDPNRAAVAQGSSSCLPVRFLVVCSFPDSQVLVSCSALCYNSTLNHFLFLGDNILAVLKHLAMSERLADSSEYRHGNMVFFDLLGVFVVAYPARVGTILNYVVATATFLYLAKKASLPGNVGR